MKPDIEVIISADNKLFKKSMDASELYAKRQGWKIVREFDRQERIKERIARKSQARMQKVFRVTAVASASAIGVISTAMSKAAETNAELRNELGMLKKSSDGFLSDLGDDLAPIIGSLDTIIDRVGKIRQRASDKIAMFGSSETEIANINKVLAEKKRIEAQFANDRKAQEIGRSITGDDDPDGDFKRSAYKAIRESGVDRATKARLREELEKQLSKRKAEREKKKSRSQRARGQRATQRRLDFEAEQAEINAKRDPENNDLKRKAIGAKLRADKQRQLDEIANDESLTQSERLEQVNRVHRLIGNEKANQLELLRDTIEAEKKRAEVLKEQYKNQVDQQKIELLRAQGREGEASQLSLILESERRRQKIMEMQGISDQQREALLSGEQNLLKAKSIKANGGRKSINIQAGFAGDAATLKQAVGVRSEGKQLIDINKEQQATLEEIANNTKGSPVAIAG